MAICISSKSADQVLEALCQSGEGIEPVSASDLGMFTANISDAQEFLGSHNIDDLPLHLFVGNVEDRRSSDSIVARTTTINLPDGAIKRIEEGLYVTSPELCLLQQAGELHVVNLCQMLGRFLATKSPGYKDKEALVDRSPLVSVQSVEEFLRKVPGARGARRLKEALRWTAPAAASPQETNLQLLLTLPPIYGGFALGKPVMNNRVDLEGDAKRLLKGHEAFHPDISWPEHRVGCEYQGSFHANQLGADYARALAAEAMGYRLWYVASEQLGSADQMDYIARRLAAKLDKRINEGTWPSLERVDWLLRVLRGTVIPKPSERFAVRRPRRTRRSAEGGVTPMQSV